MNDYICYNMLDFKQRKTVSLFRENISPKMDFSSMSEKRSFVRNTSSTLKVGPRVFNTPSDSNYFSNFKVSAFNEWDPLRLTSDPALFLKVINDYVACIKFKL